MEFKELKSKNSSEVSVKFTLNNKEVTDFYKEVYKKKSAELKLPGFRKGKAPVELVEKRLGDAIIPEVVEYAIEQTVKNSWDTLKYPPVSEPQCKIDKFEKDKKLVFTIDYATRPEIKLGKYKKWGVILPDLKVTDDDVDRELTILQNKYVTYEPCEDPVGLKQKLILESSDCIKGQDFSPVKEIEFFTREDDKGGEKEEHELRKIIQEKIWGGKTGDEFEVEYEPSKQPGPESEKTDSYMIKLKIKEILKKVAPELDSEFVKRVSSFDSIDKLRIDIKNQLTIHGNALLRQDISGQILEKISESSSFILPQVLIDKEIQARVQSLCNRLNLGEKTLEELAQIMGKTDEEFRKELDDISSKQFKKHLILDNVSEKERV